MVLYMELHCIHIHPYKMYGHIYETGSTAGSLTLDHHESAAMDGYTT